MPAGRPKSISNDRVFDIAKPDKAKPVGTSRPVIVNRENTITDRSMVNGVPSSPTLKPPSAMRRVIKPITVNSDEPEQTTDLASSAPVVPEIDSASLPKENQSSIVILNEPKKAAKKVPVASAETTPTTDSTAVEVPSENAEPVTDVATEATTDTPATSEESNAEEDTPKEAEVAQKEPETTPVATTAPEIKTDTASAKPEKVEEDSLKSKDEPEKATTTEAAVEKTDTKTEEKATPAFSKTTKQTAKTTDTAETNTGETKPGEVKPDESNDSKVSTGSDSAGVDALAEASTKTKEEEKAAEEQAKRDAALQGLIDSKKYFVPLAHDSTEKKSHSGAAVAVLVLILLLVGGYLAIDAKLIHLAINLPYHFFKQ